MSEATRVGNYNILLRPNPSQSCEGGKPPQGLGQSVLVQLEKTYNLFQVSQLGDKLCKFFEVTTGKTQFLKEWGTIFQGGLTMSAVTYAPVTVVNAVKAVRNAFSEASELPGAIVRNVIIVLREVTTSIATFGYAAAPFLKAHEKTSEVAGNVFTFAKGAKFVSDSCALVESGQDFWTSRNLSIEAGDSNAILPEVKTALQDTCRMNLMKLTKAVCSVAGFVLGLGVVSAGIAAAPAYTIGLASLSLVGAVLGIGSSLYATQMKHKQIDFFNSDNVKFKAPAPVLVDTVPAGQLATA